MSFDRSLVAELDGQYPSQTLAHVVGMQAVTIYDKGRGDPVVNDASVPPPGPVAASPVTPQPLASAPQRRVYNPRSPLLPPGPGMPKTAAIALPSVPQQVQGMRLRRPAIQGVETGTKTIDATVGQTKLAVTTREESDLRSLKMLTSPDLVAPRLKRRQANEKKLKTDLMVHAASLMTKKMARSVDNNKDHLDTMTGICTCCKVTGDQQEAQMR